MYSLTRKSKFTEMVASQDLAQPLSLWRRKRRAWDVLGFLALLGVAGPASNPVLAQSASVVYAADDKGLAAPPPVTGTAGEILSMLQDSSELPLETRRRREFFQEMYGRPDERLMWVGTDRMKALVKRMKAAKDDGLEPTDYPIEKLDNMIKVVSRTDDRGKGVIELWFATYFLKFATDMKVGRFLPRKIDPKLYWQEKTIDDGGALELLKARGNVEAFFNEWQPSIPAYRRLKQTLAEYRIISRGGGWQSISSGDAIKPGMTDPRVVQLRARLAATDEAAPSDAVEQPGLYDEAMVEAAKRFQSRHGLDADGVIGTKTLLQLNVPVERRIRQIVVSMERWRWMPESLGQHYIMVNIAGFELRRFRDDLLKEKMRVVVGKPYHQTPVFSKDLKYLEINPYWNVPYSIATKEELPKLKSNPAAIAAKGFEAVVGDRAVPVTAINWSKYSRKNFPVRLRQRPGPRNALGRVKFMFPNRFHVYMHDTPSRSLFARSARAFSHGCIRLNRPIDFAEQLLADVPGWSRARIEATVASRKRTVVKLPEAIPVHLTYSTVWLGEDGAIQFRSDVYQRDVRLYAALFGKHRPMM